MKLFGTDGVRGVAGQAPLDETTILRLGAALVRVLPHQGPVRLLTGRDTRESFTELAVLLESLPLAQGEFAWTICRLANAGRYVAADERQAAAWEIRQLNRRLVMLNQRS